MLLYRNKCRYFKLARATMGEGPGGVKRTGRAQSTGAVIHKCMGTTRETPCVASCLYLKLAKVMFLSFMFFSSTKSENRKVEQVLVGERG
jgi:hypothetical protein